MRSIFSRGCAVTLIVPDGDTTQSITVKALIRRRRGVSVDYNRTMTAAITFRVPMTTPAPCDGTVIVWRGEEYHVTAIQELFDIDMNQIGWSLDA